MPATDKLTAGLRAWAARQGQDPNVRAAVNLLLSQSRWFEDEKFAACCIHADGQIAWIDWGEARVFLHLGPPCSRGELAMLQLIVDLGSDRYQFSRLDSRNTRLAIAAFTEAAPSPRAARHPKVTWINAITSCPTVSESRCFVTEAEAFDAAVKERPYNNTVLSLRWCTEDHSESAANPPRPS